MATLTQILSEENKQTAAEKVEAIASIVTKARKAYGNSEEEIDSVQVNTASGMIDMKYVTDADKVAVAGQVVGSIKREALETVQLTQGSKLDKEIERLIACHPVLANIAQSSDSEYL